MNIEEILSSYDTAQLTVAALGSHSALDIASGAKRYGFRTLVVAQKGREETYARHYRATGAMGCVDEVIVLENFKDILKPETQDALRSRNAVFVPHRSFEVYLDFDYGAIERSFRVPILGNRRLLRIEERSSHPNQYDLLRAAGIRMPRVFERPEDIDRPVIVKVLERERAFERAFFLAGSREEYLSKSEAYLAEGIITERALQEATVEEFIAGVQVNLNYFHSPLSGRIEFLGSDTRRQTNIEGFLRLPAALQEEAAKSTRLRHEEAGHIAVTLLESMLEDVFRLGEQFSEAARQSYAPGVIGPFALQAFIVPGPPKKEFVVFDVSPRMPGSPGISSTPYGAYLWGEPMPVGKRIALEIKEALSGGALPKLVT